MLESCSSFHYLLCTLPNMIFSNRKADPSFPESFAFRGPSYFSTMLPHGFMCQTSQHQWCQPPHEGVLGLCKMPRIFWQAKVARYGGLGGRDIFPGDPVRSRAVLLSSWISFVVAQIFWNLKLNYYKYWCSSHLYDKQLLKRMASAANLFQTWGEIDPHMSEWLSLWKGFSKKQMSGSWWVSLFTLGYNIWR